MLVTRWMENVVNGTDGRNHSEIRLMSSLHQINKGRTTSSLCFSFTIPRNNFLRSMAWFCGFRVPCSFLDPTFWSCPCGQRFPIGHHDSCDVQPVSRRSHCLETRRGPGRPASDHSGCNVKMARLHCPNVLHLVLSTLPKPNPPGVRIMEPALRTTGGRASTCNTSQKHWKPNRPEARKNPASFPVTLFATRSWPVSLHKTKEETMQPKNDGTTACQATTSPNAMLP